MRRVLFQWGRVTVYSYPAMLYLGIVSGILAQLRAAETLHLDSSRALAATLLLLMPALVGARLLFVATHLESFRRQPLRIWRAQEGGAAMYGGLLLATPLSIPLLDLFSLSFGEFWDCASFTLLIGMIITRAGCVLNGCCAGRPSDGPLGINLPDRHGVWKRRIPVQALEAAWGLAILAGGIACWGRLPFPGLHFLHTLGAYGAGRIVLESAREVQDGFRGFSLNRAISLVFVGASLAGLTLVWLR